MHLDIGCSGRRKSEVKLYDNSNIKVTCQNIECTNSSLFLTITGGSKRLELFNSLENSDERGTSSTGVHCFPLSIIIAATNNFAFSEKLGQGGFGTVYKVHIVNY